MLLRGSIIPLVSDAFPIHVLGIDPAHACRDARSDVPGPLEIFFPLIPSGYRLCYKPVAISSYSFLRDWTHGGYFRRIGSPLDECMI
jgi:hypothetical protein